MLQRGVSRAVIPGGHVLKFHLSLQIRSRAGAVFLTRLQIQHRRHPVPAGDSLGDGDDQVCHLDQLHQNLGHIIVEGNDQSLCQHAAFHLQRTHMHQQHHRQIDDHVGHRVHQGGNPSCGQLLAGHVLRFFLKGRNLRVLLAESPQHPNARQILPGRGGHAVKGRLHPPVHGHGDQHNAENDDAQHRNDPGEHQRRLKIDGKSHDHGAEHHEWRAQQQPQCQVHAVLHLIDVGGHPGDHGGCAQLIDLTVA